LNPYLCNNLELAKETFGCEGPEMTLKKQKERAFSPLVFDLVFSQVPLFFSLPPSLDFGVHAQRNHVVTHISRSEITMRRSRGKRKKRRGGNNDGTFFFFEEERKKPETKFSSCKEKEDY
jgi:hypothetical protein